MRKTGKNVFAGRDGKPSQAVPQPYWRAAALHGGGTAALRAQCEFLSPPGAEFGCADQRPLGDRQPHRLAARALFRRGQSPGREPCAGCRCQSLSRYRRLARLRLSRHDRADQARPIRSKARPIAMPIPCRSISKRRSTSSTTPNPSSRCSASASSRPFRT